MEPARRSGETVERPTDRGPDADRAGARRAGAVAAFVVLAVFGGLALTVDFPKTAVGFKGDEATYYLMGHSLAADWDLAYRQADLQRATREFESGPAGVFLKKGQRVAGVRLVAAPPFFRIAGAPDPDRARLFYGKSYIYPALAAPFVRLFGTNGFLVFNALLLAAAFWAAFTFLSARSGTAAALTLSSAFVFATVVPVYFVWIAPELFNFSIGLLACFFWLYKHVVRDRPPHESRWLRGEWTDGLAAVLIGIATFSKVTNVLLLLPFVGWLLRQGQLRRALLVCVLWGVVTAGLFGVNVAVTGDWNYQGGERVTCYGKFPFQDAATGFEVCGDRARNEALGGVIFDRDVFWTNLRANLEYFFVGRNSGLVAYFFPAVFAMATFLFAFRRRASWQWFVFGGLVAQILVFIISQPYTYFGSGGSVGNRYFMGAYGLALFLLPPIDAVTTAFLPWIVGALFVAKLVLNPFYTSIRPGEHSKAGPLRWLPIELTNVNDLPINTDASRVRIWYGDNPGLHDPGFQIYYLDDNSYLKELDKSFWVRGESRAEVLIKTDRPFERLQLTLSAGPVATSGQVRLGGRTQSFSLVAGQSTQVQLTLGPGFPYKKDRDQPAYVWVLSVSSTRGFTPSLVEPGSGDTRYLGVRVRPILFP